MQLLTTNSRRAAVAAIGSLRARLHSRQGRLHVISVERSQVHYFPIPKVACSTLKFIFHELVTGEPFDPEGRQPLTAIHKRFLDDPACWLTPEKASRLEGFRFAVVRDPVDRFLSGYKNRILQFADLTSSRLTRSLIRQAGEPLEPSLEQFAERLTFYSRVSPIIAYHFKPQWSYLGDPRHRPALYDLHDLPKLADDLSQLFGRDIRFEQANKSASPSGGVSETVLRSVLRHYAEDYRYFSDLYTPPDIRRFVAA